jgi:hypothetical protein
VCRMQRFQLGYKAQVILHMLDASVHCTIIGMNVELLLASILIPGSMNTLEQFLHVIIFALIELNQFMAKQTI